MQNFYRYCLRFFFNLKLFYNKFFKTDTFFLIPKNFDTDTDTFFGTNFFLIRYSLISSLISWNSLMLFLVCWNSFANCILVTKNCPASTLPEGLSISRRRLLKLIWTIVLWLTWRMLIQSFVASWRRRFTLFWRPRWVLHCLNDSFFSSSLLSLAPSYLFHVCCFGHLVMLSSGHLIILSPCRFVSLSIW